MPRRAVLAVLGAVAGLALLFFTWYAAFHIGILERADQSIYRGFGDLGQRPRVDSIANFIARLCNPQPYVYFAALPVAAALARRRPWIAVAIGAILLGANATTELLKPLLATPRASALLGGAPPPRPASWPSGHATAAMSLALCSVLAAPTRLRPFVAALGAAFAVAVSYSFLALEWHYPSDVFGGFLVAGTWTLLGVAAIFAIDARRHGVPAGDHAPRLSIRGALGPPAAAVAGSALIAGIVILARPHAVVSYARAHESFVVGAGAIGALGLALATGLMLALRR
jgi:membrane-associated phospholipid phosphatase